MFLVVNVKYFCGKSTKLIVSRKNLQKVSKIFYLQKVCWYDALVTNKTKQRRGL